MKVIGAGFGRTGTMSLKGALEQLGFGPSFHMIDVARQPELLPAWQAAVDGEHVTVGVAQLTEENRRALDVREQERNGAARPLVHRLSLARGGAP